MKKIIVVLSACVLLFSASLANAAALASGGTTTTDALSVYGDITAAAAAASTSTLLGKLSKGVLLSVNFTGAGYSIITKHNSGITQYGTAYDSTAIYKQDVGSATITAPSAANNTSFATGWSAM